MTILFSKPSQTGRELARALTIPIAYRKSQTLNEARETVIIRWGNVKKLSYTPTRTINKAEAILRASDKVGAIRTWIENGIPTVNITSTKFPCIGRPYRHSRGKKFWVCTNAQEVQQAKNKGAQYFTLLYPKTKEYRVHVAFGKAILVSEKIGDTSKVIWNKDINDFVFRHLHRSTWLYSERLMDMIRNCKAAVQVLDLDFGAVDVMAEPKDRAYSPFAILEVNTAPALSPLALDYYRRAFREALLLP